MKKCIHVDLQYSLTAQIKNVYAVGYIKDGFPTVIHAQFTEEIYPVQMLCFCRAELHRTFFIILNNALARQLFKRRASLAPNTFLIFACFVFSRAVWERAKRCAYPFITTILKLICLTAYRANVQLCEIGINHTTRKYRLFNIVISAELILSNHEKLVSSVPL